MATKSTKSRTPKPSSRARPKRTLQSATATAAQPATQAAPASPPLKPTNVIIRAPLVTNVDVKNEPSEWTCEAYDMTAARSTREAEQPQLIAGSAVLEITLASGHRILTRADEAHRYFATGVGSTEARGVSGNAIDGANKDGAHTIEIGASLSPSPEIAQSLMGARDMSGTARDGTGIASWIVSALRIFKPKSTDAATLTATQLCKIAEARMLGNEPGLYQLTADAFTLTKVDVAAQSTAPTLLFIHGTLSSTAGSFAKLWDTRAAGNFDQYQGRIYALEHYSLSQSPIENALDAVRSLPKGTKLHLVTHSRGGLVGELIARAGRIDKARIDKEPFTKSDLDAFVASANQRDDQAAFAEQRKLLEELAKELKARSIVVERFVRVACPARGTTLASGKLDRWASVFLNAIGGVGTLAGLNPVAGSAYSALKSFLLAVVEARTDAQAIPGIEAMMPDAPLIRLLNDPQCVVASPLRIVAGDYVGDKLMKRLVDYALEQYYDGQNDTVVNTPSMTGGAQRGDIKRAFFAAPGVSHFTYFARAESVRVIYGALRGEDDGYIAVNASDQRVTIARGGLSVTSIFSHGGWRPRSNPTAPIVYVLPGIMGSNLAIGNDRIWMEYHELLQGNVRQLHMGENRVRPDGLVDQSYWHLLEHLVDGFEVRPWAYDWRKSIAAAAGDFALVLQTAFGEAQQRGQPLYIMAHSMGGLVARLALSKNNGWQQLKDSSGRLMQLGTPNQGSHGMACVLMARDKFVNILATVGHTSNKKELLDVVSAFPGVLELLPFDAVANGSSFQDAATWQTFQSVDPSEQSRWPIPDQTALNNARSVQQAIANSSIDKDCTIYIAGRDKTPVAVRAAGNEIEVEHTYAGDGRVPWATGIPKDVPTWYVNEAHGDLCAARDAFKAYVDLLTKGQTSERVLKRDPAELTRDAGTRTDMNSVTRQIAPRDVMALHPTPEELIAAAMGGSTERLTQQFVPSERVQIEVEHGSLHGATSPVLIGHYAYDVVKGSLGALDQQLNGRIKADERLGLLPSQIEERYVYLGERTAVSQPGAIVVGLGMLGSLTPRELQKTVQKGLLTYVRDQTSSDPTSPRDLSVTALLIGTNYGGLEVRDSLIAIVQAALEVNDDLSKLQTSEGSGGESKRIAKLRICELMEDRAIAAAQVLDRLEVMPRFVGRVSFDGRVHVGKGGLTGISSESATNFPRRIHITQADNTLRFTYFDARARNEVIVEPTQQALLRSLIAQASASTIDSIGLSRTLFELAVPNAYKESIGDQRELALVVDKDAASYPWELMRDAASQNESPLATRVAVVRQLATERYRSRPKAAQGNRALVVGDTFSQFARLPGAQEEARHVVRALDAQYECTKLGRFADADPMRDPIAEDATQIVERLFDGEYRILHFAAHGVVDFENQEGVKESGMVIGENMILSPASVRKLMRVPELVFINCCHLGSMDGDAKDSRRKHRNQLAANLACEFIEMGAKAVIAAGWAVNDEAARVFAVTFYQCMLNDERFADAICTARAAAYAAVSNCNTWGAYQAYGDAGYRLYERDTGSSTRAKPLRTQNEVLFELDRLNSEAQFFKDDKRVKEKVAPLITQVERDWSNHAAVNERVGDVYATLNDSENAVRFYRRATECEDGSLSLRGIERMANHLARIGVSKNDRKLIDESLDWLQRLTAIGKTSERMSLIGGSYKRLAKLHAQSSTKGAQRDSVKIVEAVQAMTKAYAEATALAIKQPNANVAYPLLNALYGVIALDAFGAKLSGVIQLNNRSIKSVDDIVTSLTQIESALPALDSADVFTQTAPIHAKFVQLLCAAFKGENDAEAAHQLGVDEAAMNSLYRSGSEARTARHHAEFLVSMFGGAKGNAAKALDVAEEYLKGVSGQADRTAAESAIQSNQLAATKAGKKEAKKR